MGIFGALTTSVAGMRAQSYRAGKHLRQHRQLADHRVQAHRHQFSRPHSATAADQPQLAGSVTANSRSTNTVQGDVQAASVATYMAINGDGFFSVQKPGSFTDNTPVFDGVDRYTRRGDFQLDKSGYLVNGAGYYLRAFRSIRPPATWSARSPQVLQFQNDFLPAQATTKIDYRANLASYPLTTAHDKSVPGSELLRPAAFTPAIIRWSVGTPPRPISMRPRGGTVAEQQGRRRP